MQNILFKYGLLAVLVGSLAFFCYTFISVSASKKVVEKELQYQKQEVTKLQESLSKCTSNNFSIRKLKGKGSLEVLQSLQNDSRETRISTSDTLAIVRWFCDLPFSERRKWNRNSQ